jgi:hypothetical protein
LVIFFILALLIMLSGLRQYLFLQKIKDTPVSKVSSAPVGLVALEGRAKSKVPEMSPISKIPCVFWRIIVKYCSTGRSSGWTVLYSRESKNLFFVEDDSGKMLVTPEGAQIEIPSYTSYEGYIREYESLGMNPATMDECVLDYIESLDADEKESFLALKSQNFHVDEYIIREGDPIFVLGTATIPGEDPSIPKNQEDLIICRGTNDATLYISDSSERDVIKTVSSQMYVPIFGGLIISGVCLYILLIMVWT